MNEDLEFILDRVFRHDNTRGLYKEMAERWVKMWQLDPGFTKPLHEAILKGHEQVVLPTPFNVVNLSQRLLSTTPTVDVIPEDINDQESEYYATQCEKWLTAMWKVVNRQQQRNILADNIWYSLVYGRFVFDVRWIKDMLPSLLKKTAFPISIRALNPTNVGIQQGPYCTEFSYHKYETSLLEVMRRWPDLKNAENGSKLRGILDQYERDDGRHEDNLVYVVDYWATDPDTGAVWNAILVEDEFAKPYKKTNYPYIPIICGRGDYGVGIGDEMDGLSILHSIDGLWQYQCRLASQMATGLLWYFWPQFLVSNENGQPVDDIEISPMQTTAVPAGTKVEQVTMNPNVPLAQAVSDSLQNYVQQSTYPEVMFGQGPADLKSGYGVSLLSDAAKGRIKNFQESLEMALTHVNELVLCLVEKKGGKDGVSIRGVNERDNQKYALNLSKKEIQGNYANEVRITPAMPQDDLQIMVQGVRLADQKYISAETLRDKFLGIKTPTDETRRIALEEAMQSDELRPYRLRTAMEQYYGPENALTILYESKAMDLMPALPEGYEWTKNPTTGKVEMKKKRQALPGPPPEVPPPGGPPMGPPGGLPPGMAGPPMGPPPGGPPPGPPMGPPGPPMPPMGPPPMAGPPMGAGPIQPGAALAPPLGGGLPPTMQGQVEGENLGMPQDMDPLLFDMLMNTPASPNEEMMMSAGLPPGGPPY